MSNNLVVVGFGRIEKTATGELTCSTPIVDYIRELSEPFDKVTWISPYSLTEGRFSTAIESTKIYVVPYRPGSINQLLRAYVEVVLQEFGRPTTILHLPTAVDLLPMLPLIKLMSRKLMVYIGGDYDNAIRSGLISRRPGWAQVFRIGNECPLRIADIVLARGHHLSSISRRFNNNVHETMPIGQSNLSYSAERHSSEDVPSNSCTVLYVGSLAESKGVDDLVTAFKTLKQEYLQGSEPTLEIVGDGPTRHKIEEQVERLGLREDVQFWGWIDDQSRLQKRFRQASVLVVPSRNNEGVPRVIDEAIALAIPVVSTEIPGMSQEFVQGEVAFVPPNDPNELARVITRVLNDRSFRDSLLANASTRAKWIKKWPSAASQHLSLLGTTQK